MRLPNSRETYQKETEIRLKKIRSRITSLEKRAAIAEADIEIRYGQKMDEIRGQYAQAKDKLAELDKASQAVWVDQKTELDRTIDTLSEAVEMIARQISV